MESKKILVADDDPSIRDLCGLILQTEGFEVLTAEDAVTCVALSRQENPDLVLLDWMMPEVDGMDALRLLKASDRTRHIPVVMLTALDSAAQITEATLNGADGYVTKPFEGPDLVALVCRFTGVVR
ncbi:MAG: response regulator [Armatimonadetes bacterium]|nr:response regulator [Armatimonadota bacterium]